MEMNGDVVKNDASASMDDLKVGTGSNSPSDPFHKQDLLVSDLESMSDKGGMNMKTQRSYSCSRCRRLKKRCSKESPKCANCSSSDSQCHYPGRAPRRSKKEVLAARMEEYEEQERKKKAKVMPNTLNMTSFSRSDDNSDNKSPNNLYTPNSLTDPVTDPHLKAVTISTGHENNVVTPGVTENINSLISALGSTIEMPAQIGPNTQATSNATGNTSMGLTNDNPIMSTDQATLMFQGLSQYAQSPPILATSTNGTTMSPLTFSALSMKQNHSSNNDRLSLPLQTNYMGQGSIPPTIPMLVPSCFNKSTNSVTSDKSIGTGGLMNDFKKPQMKDQNHKIGPVSHDFYSTGQAENYMHQKIESSAFESTPIIDSAIQNETVLNVFQGGRETTWAKEGKAYKQIDRSLYDRFIAAYFNHNHRTFPMIDKIAFLNKVSTIRDFQQMEEFYNETFIFKLYMVMAIGCTTLQRAGMLNKSQAELSEHFAYIAMKRFSVVIKLQNIETVKCLLLLGIYSFFEPKGVSSWTISGLIMRLTIALGLNRKLPEMKKIVMTESEIELRTRVFWSAYCFERLVATSLGRISAIDDDEINVALPKPLYPDEESDLEVTLTTITLRRLSGRIHKNVHSISMYKKNLTPAQKNEIITELRKEIDDTYTAERAKLKKQKDKNYSMSNFNTEVTCDDPDMISFHSSDIWLAMRYSQFQIMLYRPSALIPKPSLTSLTTLGEFCLKALKFTYTLYKKKMLPLNWITLFRALTICNTMLYCLCNWSIDLIESEKEIQQCVEILKHFGEKWIFAIKCADVFQNISGTIVEISLSNGKVPNMDKLTKELFGASDAYKEILDQNNVDVSWLDEMN